MVKNELRTHLIIKSGYKSDLGPVAALSAQNPPHRSGFRLRHIFHLCLTLAVNSVWSAMTCNLSATHLPKKT